MHWIDWIIVCLPCLLVIAIGLKSRKYLKGVSGFLAAGRVAGRYVVAVAGAEAAAGLIGLVAAFEAYYNSGLAYSFWNQIGVPIGILFILTGYCIYRYRETRAMTMGQFFEMRYNRAFRIYACIIQAMSGVLNYAIFPGVGAKFLVYFLDMPIVTPLWGWEIPTFMIVMAIFLFIEVMLVNMGGQITIMTTDCIQGILSYPMFAIVVIYLLMKFSWFNDIVPPLLNRPDGKSFLNPFDIEKLRDFNVFYVVAGILGLILNKMAWSGSHGYNAAAKNAHEQKMGGVLGVWRGGYKIMMYLLLAVCAYAYLNGGNFTKQASEVRIKLATRVMEDVNTELNIGNLKNDYNIYLKTGKMSAEMQKCITLARESDVKRKLEIQASKIKWGLINKEKAKSQLENKVSKNNTNVIGNEIALDVGEKMLRGYGIASNKDVSSQSFKAIFGQMRAPMAIKAMLPIGVLGVFCALCVFMMISTNTTYLHVWGSIFVQDIILPIRGKPFTPRRHLFWLRMLVSFVALFAFLFSAFFSQIDFILMFFAITGTIWLGGAGSCIVGGLYWKRGTSAGAFAALTVGSVLAVTGMISQKLWETGIYPLLESYDLVGSVAVWLTKVSAPFNPYIKWEMSPTKFPINSQEIYFLAMVFSISSYIVVSLLTCKKPHNMDRLLHRGKYRREGKEVSKEKKSLRMILNKLIGIDSQYTPGDRIIARAVFCYSFVWGFGSFITVVIWNKISPWPKEWWGNWYFITTIVVAGIVGIISTFWFTIGGTLDLVKLFKALAIQETNVLDDGRVVEGVSADDVVLVEKVDHIRIEEAHVEENILEEELRDEGDIEDIENLRKHESSNKTEES